MVLIECREADSTALSPIITVLGKLFNLFLSYRASLVSLNE